MAVDDNGHATGSMGVDAGDYDGSGRASLWVTNFQGQMHGGQELAGLVVELMGNAAALGFLGFQELARQGLQPRPPGLHFGVELGIGEGGGGLGRKELCQRQGLCIEGPTQLVPEAERTDHPVVAQEWQGQHRAHGGGLEAGSDGSRDGEARIAEDVGRDHELAGTDGQPHRTHPGGSARHGVAAGPKSFAAARAISIPEAGSS